MATISERQSLRNEVDKIAKTVIFGLDGTDGINSWDEWFENCLFITVVEADMYTLIGTQIQFSNNVWVDTIDYTVSGCIDDFEYEVSCWFNPDFVAACNKRYYD